MAPSRLRAVPAPLAQGAPITNHGDRRCPHYDGIFLGGIAFLLTTSGEELPFDGFLAYGSGTYPATAGPGETVAVPLHVATQPTPGLWADALIAD